MSELEEPTQSHAEPFSKDKFRTYLRKQWAGKGEVLADDARLGIEVSELIEASQERNATIEAPFLDLWIGILDEFNSWLISLLSVVFSPDRAEPMNDFERSITLILTKLISDTTAIRHLIVLGFDSAARTLLRSTVEYVQVLVAIIDDPVLAVTFVTSTTPETANAFYFDQLARGKLAKRIEAAWTTFFRSDDDSGRFFASRLRKDGSLLAGTAHPSFAGGHQSVLGFIQNDPDEIWLGHWGAKSHMSILTIQIYIDCLMSLTLLTDFPFIGFETWLQKPITYDSGDELHRHVKLGRSVLSSLILSLYKESNFPHLYPAGFEPDQPTEE